jgi:hypothetical protein
MLGSAKSNESISRYEMPSPKRAIPPLPFVRSIWTDIIIAATMTPGAQMYNKNICQRFSLDPFLQGSGNIKETQQQMNESRSFKLSPPLPLLQNIHHQTNHSKKDTRYLHSSAACRNAPGGEPFRWIPLAAPFSSWLLHHCCFHYCPPRRASAIPSR